MSNNPINLTVRFLLEIFSLIVMGIWGWQNGNGIMRFVLAVGIPLVAAAIWGTFRVPNDPGNSPVPIPGPIRLIYEMVYFGFAIWTLFDLQYKNFAKIMLVILVIHYLFSYDRVIWLVRNKEFKIN